MQKDCGQQTCVIEPANRNPIGLDFHRILSSRVRSGNLQNFREKTTFSKQGGSERWRSTFEFRTAEERDLDQAAGHLVTPVFVEAEVGTN